MASEEDRTSAFRTMATGRFQAMVEQAKRQRELDATRSMVPWDGRHRGLQAQRSVVASQRDDVIDARFWPTPLKRRVVRRRAGISALIAIPTLLALLASCEGVGSQGP